MRSAVDRPAFASYHWPQQYGEPLVGRTYDGEDCNIGFVDVTDTPCPEMVAVTNELRAELCARRGGN